MAAMLIVLFLILIMVLAIAGRNHRMNRIEEKIRSMGGEVINIERRGFFSGIGPFRIVGKGRVVYRIEYRLGSEIMEGWVRFGGLFGPDWRL